MYEGLKSGDSAVIENVVTEDMFPSFDGSVVHPVFSTVSLVHHMEWAARRLILPYLEPKEEGMGASVNLRHSSPAFEGDKIVAEATVTKIKPTIIVCDVRVVRDTTTIGHGSVTQIIIPKTYVEKHPERKLN